MNDRYLYKAKIVEYTGNNVNVGEWVVGCLVVNESATDKFKYRIQPIEDGFLFAPPINPSTICQCTGLKDKNGKLIWENDVVRDDNGNIYKAFWRDRYYQFSWICVKSDKLPIGAKWDFWSIRNYEIEVVGSAIDNPELLEVGE